MNAAIDKCEERRARYGLFVVLVQSMILALLLVVAISYKLFGDHPEGFIYPVCVFLLLLFAWTLWSWSALAGDLFDPYVLFMTAAFAFNAGLAFLEVFHLNKGGIFNGRFPQQTMLETLFLVAIGLTVFHFGALVAAFRRSRKAAPSEATQKQERDSRSLRMVGWALIGVAVIPTVLVLRQSTEVVSTSGYSGLFQQGIQTGFGTWPQVLSAFLIPGSLFLIAGSKGKRSVILVASSIFLIYCAILFFLGQRGEAIMPILAYLWLFHRSVHKVPKTAIAAIALLLIFVLIPVFAVFRDFTGEERYSLTGYVDAYTLVKTPAVAGLSEMGTSMQTVSYTIELVPKTRGYDMGVSYYSAMLAVLPNLFWRVHPAMARSFPSVWLVQTVAPNTAAHGGGLGYSFVAEAYLNFGWWGAPIFIGLLGFLFGSIVLWADRSGEIVRLAMLASFVSFFLLFARGQAANVFRPLVWHAVLPYLAVRLLGHTGFRYSTIVGTPDSSMMS